MRHTGTTSLLAQVPWQTLAIASGFVWALTFSGYEVIATLTGISYLPLILGVIGVVYIVGGLLLTLRSRFELFPIKRYIMGSVLMGVCEFFYLLALLSLLLLTEVSLVYIAVIALVSTIPGVLIRKYALSKRISILTLAGVLLVIFGWWCFLGMPLEVSQTLLMSLGMVLAMVIRSCIQFWLKLDVLSPWVAAFWKGCVFVVLAIVLGFYGVTVGMLPQELLLTIPAYLVIFFGAVGALELLTLFLRRKTSMAGGLIAYKEAIILLVCIGVVVSVSFIEGVSGTLLSFAGIPLMLLGYLCVEERVFGIVGLKNK